MRTKVVVRNLPPPLSEDAFKEAVGKSFVDRAVWLTYHQGKNGTKRKVPSLAYLAFRKNEDVLEFFSHFHDHLFVSERGTQMRAQVEYAPFQQIPKARQRKDPREGTYEKDPEYLAFLEQLHAPQQPLPSAEVQLERREAEEKAALVANDGKVPVVMTPLMQWLMQKSEERVRARKKGKDKAEGKRGVAVAARPISGVVSKKAYAKTHLKQATHAPVEPKLLLRRPASAAPRDAAAAAATTGKERATRTMGSAGGANAATVGGSAEKGGRGGRGGRGGESTVSGEGGRGGGGGRGGRGGGRGGRGTGAEGSAGVKGATRPQSAPAKHGVSGGGKPNNNGKALFNNKGGGDGVSEITILARPGGGGGGRGRGRGGRTTT